MFFREEQPVVHKQRNTNRMAQKEIILVDMDNVVVGEPDPAIELELRTLHRLVDDPMHWSDIPGIFATLKPYPGAVEAYRHLSIKYDLYIVSTPPWANPSGWTDKRKWIGEHLPEAAYKVFLTHNKHMVKGKYIIDDRKANGVEKFPGIHIHFQQEGFEDWSKVIAYFDNLNGT